MTAYTEKALEVLLGARELVIKGWTQRAYARTTSGKAVPSSTPGAVCFCSMGALNRAAADCEASDAARFEARNLLEDVFGNRRVVMANDAPDTKHEHIVMAFDFAILQAQDKLRTK